MPKGQTLEALFDERLPLYKRYADITVDGTDTEKAVEIILQKLNGAVL